MRSRAAIGKHPLHPALVALPIGAFTLTVFGDLSHQFTRQIFWYDFSRWCLLAGVLTALLAAATGLIDYFGVRMSPAGRRLATIHMVLNLTGVALFALSLVLRWNHGALANSRWPLAFGLALIAFAGLGAAGWIGGKLVFEHKVGVVENQDAQATEIGRQEAAGIALTLALAALLSAACGGKIATKAVDQAAVRSTEQEKVSEIQVPEGFRAVRVAEGFTYPSSITWDDQGRLYVLESHTVAIPGLEPRVLRVKLDPEGSFEEIELTGDQAPTGKQAVGIEFQDGWIYLSHEQEDGSWGVSRFRPDGGTVEAVLRNLPGGGDHFPNYIAFDRAGTLYVGSGSASNSGVISSHDPVNQKWLKSRPQVADIPCEDVVLTGQKFTDTNEMTKEDEADKATTGAYQPYGQSEAKRIEGKPLCTGAIYRLRPGAKDPEVVAWGFRNPVALAFDLQDRLLVGMHGADIRGTRPINDDPDAVYWVKEGMWYGWPDYSAALLPYTDRRYMPPMKYMAEGQTRIAHLFDHAASGLKAPDKSVLVTATDPHAALGGMTVVPQAGPFARWAGQLLISEMGDFRPTTDAAKPHVRDALQLVD